MASKYDAEKNAKLHDDIGVETRSARSDLFSTTDPALDRKMHLINDALDEIGMTGYQWKLFCLNGFGYAVDSLILLLQSIIAGNARTEFKPSFPNGLTIAVYVGMLVGALFWGFGADIIGRKIAFNVSLFISAVFAIVAGAANSWILLGFFVSVAAFGSGGNLVMDTAVFLEYLPSRSQWLLTLMACWWGIGQLVAGLLAWAFLPNFSCPTGAAVCNREDNMGWRYVWFSGGGIVLVLSILRVTVIKMKETPKFLVAQGRDAEVVETFQYIAQKYNRPCSLTLAQLEACGELKASAHRKPGRKVHFSFREFRGHLSGLFATRKIGVTTGLIWASWLLIGLAYPLYNVFLPTYLATRGAQFGVTSVSVYWRNYALSNLSSIFGPIIAGFLCEVRHVGRKGTMVIGALITMAFFLGYPFITNDQQNVGLNCAISCCLNIYYGTLYAYSPEAFPSAHRTTGGGIAVGWNRIMGIVSALVAYYANTASSIPIWVCAALYGVLALIAALFPFEPMGKRSA